MSSQYSTKEDLETIMSRKDVNDLSELGHGSDPIVYKKPGAITKAVRNVGYSVLGTIMGVLGTGSALSISGCTGPLDESVLITTPAEDGVYHVKPGDNLDIDISYLLRDRQGTVSLGWLNNSGDWLPQNYQLINTYGADTSVKSIITPGQWLENPYHGGTLTLSGKVPTNVIGLLKTDLVLQYGEIGPKDIVSILINVDPAGTSNPTEPTIPTTPVDPSNPHTYMTEIANSMGDALEQFTYRPGDAFKAVVDTNVFNSEGGFKIQMYRNNALVSETQLNLEKTAAGTTYQAPFAAMFDNIDLVKLVGNKTGHVYDAATFLKQ